MGNLTLFPIMLEMVILIPTNDFKNIFMLEFLIRQDVIPQFGTDVAPQISALMPIKHYTKVRNER